MYCLLKYVFFNWIFNTNRCQMNKFMMPIIHTQIIGIMEI